MTSTTASWGGTRGSSLRCSRSSRVCRRHDCGGRRLRAGRAHGGSGRAARRAARRRGGPVRAVRRRREGARAGGRCSTRPRGGTAVGGRPLRCRALPARRELHARRGRRRFPDAPRRAAGRRCRRVHLGVRRGHGDAAPVLGGRADARLGRAGRGGHDALPKRRGVGGAVAPRRARRRHDRPPQRRVDLLGLRRALGTVHVRRRPGGRVSRPPRAGAARRGADGAVHGRRRTTGSFTLRATACAVRGTV